MNKDLKKTLDLLIERNKQYTKPKVTRTKEEFAADGVIHRNLPTQLHIAIGYGCYHLRFSTYTKPEKEDILFLTALQEFQTKTNDKGEQVREPLSGGGYWNVQEYTWRQLFSKRMQTFVSTHMEILKTQHEDVYREKIDSYSNVVLSWDAKKEDVRFCIEHQKYKSVQFDVCIDADIGLYKALLIMEPIYTNMLIGYQNYDRNAGTEADSVGKILQRPDPELEKVMSAIKTPEKVSVPKENVNPQNLRTPLSLAPGAPKFTRKRKVFTCSLDINPDDHGTITKY